MARDGSVYRANRSHPTAFLNVDLTACIFGEDVLRPCSRKVQLHGKRTRKGFFVTTSSLSPDEKECVDTIDPGVVPVGGQRLAELMIDFNIGVSTSASYAIKRVDSDYFVED